MLRTYLFIGVLAVSGAFIGATFAADLAPKKPVVEQDKSMDKSTTEKTTTETTDTNKSSDDIDTEHKGQDPKKEIVPKKKHK